MEKRTQVLIKIPDKMDSISIDIIIFPREGDLIVLNHPSLLRGVLKVTRVTHVFGCSVPPSQIYEQKSVVIDCVYYSQDD